MRYRLNKIVVVILLVLSISIPIIAINANAEDANATKIDSCERVWKEYDATTVAEFLAKENDYPTLDDYLFAGWYTDEVCDSAHALKGNTPSGTTYALFVPEHVLSVKAQVSAHLIDGKITEEDDAASIRFVTTVDSLLYKKVGFEVTYIGKDGTQKESFSETNTVYERLYVTGSDKTWSETPYGSFCGVSQFFRAHTITDVPSSHYDTVFTVKPYWITLDGDKVYGVQDTKSIAQGAKVDITINNDGTNGTASADKEWYLPGETVTLSGKGIRGYRCIGMTVNGTKYELDANGKYSFVTEKGKTYTVSGIYENVFDLNDSNSAAWNLDNLDEGIVTLPNGGFRTLALAKNYKNIDLTVTARDYAANESVARTDIYFKFTNGAYISFSTSIINDNGTHHGELALTTINRGLYTSDDGKQIYTRGNVWGYLSDEMKTQYITTGLDIRVVRYGTDIYLFAGKDLITVANLANNASYPVTEDVEATIEIRHWEDSGVDVEIPFKVSETVGTVSGNMKFTHPYTAGTTATLSTKTMVLAHAVTNIDLTLQTKRHRGVLPESEKYDVMFEFENGKHLSFYLGILNGKWSIATLNHLDDEKQPGKFIYPRYTEWHTLTSAEDDSFMNKTLDFRIVRDGTDVLIYIDGQYINTADLTYNDSGVKADTKAKVTVRHFGTPNSANTTGDVQLTVPFEFTKDLDKVRVTTSTGVNGSVTTDRAYYMRGDSVKVTVAGETDYYYDSLTVNGTEVKVESDGTYTFEATEKTYDIRATFAKKLFADNTTWDVVNQNKGIVTLPNGGFSTLAFAKKYKDIDLTVTARDYASNESVARTDIYFKFANGAYISFSTSIINDNGTHHGELALTTINRGLYTSDDGKQIYTRGNVWGYLSDEMKTQYITTGLDIRVVRYGTDIYLFAGEDLITVANLANNASYPVTEDMEATIEIRHWEDSGVDVEIPFKVSEEVDAVEGNMRFTHPYTAGTTAALSTKTMVLAHAVTNIDLTLQTKRHREVLPETEKYDVLFEFENGKNLSFYLGIVGGKWSIANLNSAKDVDNTGKIIYSRDKVWHTLTETEDNSFMNETLDLRIVRDGTDVLIYIDGQYIDTADLTNNNSGVNADTKAKVTVRHYGKPNPANTTGDVHVAVPFELTKAVGVTTLSFNESPYGTVTPDKTEYSMGDTIVLTGKGKSGYRCTGLNINGEKVSLNSDGFYSFVARESNYIISGGFERVFADNAGWDLTKLDEGVISLPEGGKGGDNGAGWLELYGEFTDIDITVKARDYNVDVTGERTDILFVFENGAHVSFGLTTFTDGQVGIQTFNKEANKNDPRNIYSPFTDWGQHLTGDSLRLYQSSGVDFRVQRVGTNIYLYVNGTQHPTVADLTNNADYPVTDKMKANVYLRHWGDDGVEVVMPFSISATPDTELFYTNSKKVSVADPFVLDNTKVDGYYYMYGTPATSSCYRSTNLMDWKSMGSPLDKSVSTEVTNALSTSDWAPEVVYDAVTETYYMFFSATPLEDTTVTGSESGTALYLLMVATSKSPYKDFELVDFTDAESCGADNVRTADSNYPQYYAKYALFEPTKHATFCREDKTYTSKFGGHLPAIDPHPYEDETGKYLFWVDQDGDDRICVVKMENWLTPIWETATVLTCGGYYTTDDYAKAQQWWGAGALLVDKVPYDKKGATNDYINEAPEVVKHNGKYYLTYSTGAYADNTYQVIQAVSTTDSPMGPYRKLTEAEGAILLSASVTGSQEVTGAGHHSFVTADDKFYMIYHRHDSTTTMGGSRNPAIDEVKWITIKDKDGNDLDVMYVNGPTSTLQPKIDAYSEYVNIAEDDGVTVSANTNTNNLSCLTDGLLSVHKNMNATFIENVKETTISEATTFTFDFESARAVRGIMVYNSKTRSTCFMNISQIKLVCEENGVETTHTIENIQFSSEYYTDSYVTPGAAAYTEFDEMNVKSIEITIDVPEGQDSVGISEVRILGN